MSDKYPDIIGSTFILGDTPSNVQYGEKGETFRIENGVLSIYTPGGKPPVGYGGTVNGAIVGNGGHLAPNDSGTECYFYDITVDAGGTFYTWVGDTISGVVVNGGYWKAWQRASISDVTVQAGSMALGGTDASVNGLRVNGGLFQNQWGTVTNWSLANNGKVDLYLSKAILMDNGTQTGGSVVYKMKNDAAVSAEIANHNMTGGSISMVNSSTKQTYKLTNVVVNGATAEITVGGTAAAKTIVSDIKLLQGKMTIGNATLKGTIVAGGNLNLTAGIIDSDATYAISADYLVSDGDAALTGFNLSQTKQENIAITVRADKENGTYTLITGATSYKQTFTLKVGECDEVSINIGESKLISGSNYALNLVNDKLQLSVVAGGKADDITTDKYIFGEETYGNELGFAIKNGGKLYIGINEGGEIVGGGNVRYGTIEAGGTVIVGDYEATSTPPSIDNMTLDGGELDLNNGSLYDPVVAKSGKVKNGTAHGLVIRGNDVTFDSVRLLNSTIAEGVRATLDGSVTINGRLDVRGTLCTDKMKSSEGSCVNAVINNTDGRSMSTPYVVFGDAGSSDHLYLSVQVYKGMDKGTFTIATGFGTQYCIDGVGEIVVRDETGTQIYGGFGADQPFMINEDIVTVPGYGDFKFELNNGDLTLTVSGASDADKIRFYNEAGQLVKSYPTQMYDEIITDEFASVEVDSGAQVYDSVLSGSIMNAQRGAEIAGFTVDAGTFVYGQNTQIAADEEEVLVDGITVNGGIAQLFRLVLTDNITVTGGELIIHSSIVSNAQVSGGVLGISAGVAKSYNTYVNGGGLRVYKGTHTGLVVDAGSATFTGASWILTSATLNGGIVNFSNGTASASKVPAAQIYDTTINGAAVNVSGEVIIGSGRTYDDDDEMHDVIITDGSLTTEALVAADVTLIPTISSFTVKGGEINLVGGKLVGTIYMAGENITITVADTFDASAGDFAFDLTERTKASAAILDSENLFAQNLSINVSVTQAEGEYKLATDAGWIGDKYITVKGASGSVTAISLAGGESACVLGTDARYGTWYHLAEGEDGGLTVVAKAGLAPIDHDITGERFVYDSMVYVEDGAPFNILSGGVLYVGMSTSGPDGLVGGGTANLATIYSGGVLSTLGESSGVTEGVDAPRLNDIVVDGGTLLMGISSGTVRHSGGTAKNVTILNGSAKMIMATASNLIISSGIVSGWHTKIIGGTIYSGGIGVFTGGLNSAYNFTQEGGDMSINSGVVSGYTMNNGKLNMTVNGTICNVYNLIINGGDVILGAQQNRSAADKPAWSATIKNISINGGSVTVRNEVLFTSNNNVMNGGYMKLSGGAKTVSGVDHYFAPIFSQFTLNNGTIELLADIDALSMAMSGGMVNLGGFTFTSGYYYNDVVVTGGTLKDATIATGASRSFDETITIAGKLNVEGVLTAGTCAFAEGATANVVVTNAAVGKIADGSVFTDKISITIIASLGGGDYLLAENYSGTADITLYVRDTDDSFTLAINGDAVETDYGTYKLTLKDNKLTFSVESDYKAVYLYEIDGETSTCISSGMNLSGLTVDANKRLDIYDQGVAQGSIEEGGLVNVLAGGNLSGASLNDGGQIIVGSGGTVMDINLAEPNISGALFISKGGYVSGASGIADAQYCIGNYGTMENVSLDVHDGFSYGLLNAGTIVNLSAYVHNKYNIRQNAATAVISNFTLRAADEVESNGATYIEAGGVIGAEVYGADLKFFKSGWVDGVINLHGTKARLVFASALHVDGGNLRATVNVSSGASVQLGYLSGYDKLTMTEQSIINLYSGGSIINMVGGDTNHISGTINVFGGNIKLYSNGTNCGTWDMGDTANVNFILDDMTAVNTTAYLQGYDRLKGSTTYGISISVTADTAQGNYILMSRAQDFDRSVNLTVKTETGSSQYTLLPNVSVKDETTGMTYMLIVSGDSLIFSVGESQDDLVTLYKNGEVVLKTASVSDIVLSTESEYDKLEMSAGGAAVNTTIGSGGAMVVSGGIASNVILDGANLSGALIIEKGATVENLTGSANKSATIKVSGIVNGGEFTVGDPNAMIFYGGAMANDVVVNGGGFKLSANAIANNMTVNNGTISMVGTMSGATTINGGLVRLEGKTGSAFDTINVNGGTLEVYSTNKNYGQFNSKAVVNVNNGGVFLASHMFNRKPSLANGATINFISGGLLSNRGRTFKVSGGTINLSGGYINMHITSYTYPTSGGKYISAQPSDWESPYETDEDALDYEHWYMVLDESGNPIPVSTTAEGETTYQWTYMTSGGGLRLMDDQSKLNFCLEGVAHNVTAFVNDYTLVDAYNNDCFTISVGTQQYGDYLLFGNAATFEGSLKVTVIGRGDIYLDVNGDAQVVGDDKYKLLIDSNANLTLNITEDLPLVSLYLNGTEVTHGDEFSDIVIDGSEYDRAEVRSGGVLKEVSLKVGSVAIDGGTVAYIDADTGTTITAVGVVVSGNNGTLPAAFCGVDADISISGGEFSENTAVANEGYPAIGGVIGTYSGALYISGAYFINNVAGAKLVAEKYVVSALSSSYATDKGGISSSTFGGNTARTGGGISGGTINTASDEGYTENHAVFSGNTAAFSHYIDGIFQSRAVFFSGNTASQGGAINGHIFPFSGNTAANNEGGDTGGAIATISTKMTLENVTFTGNCAYYGGAVQINGGTADITGAFNANSAILGGAIEAWGGVAGQSDVILNIDGAGFSDNKANFGGAIFIGTDTPAVIQGGVFSANQAGQGGAIYAAANVRIENGVFSENTATDNGGALYVNTSGNVTVKDTQFATASDTIYNLGIVVFEGVITVNGELQGEGKYNLAENALVLRDFTVGTTPWQDFAFVTSYGENSAVGVLVNSADLEVGTAYTMVANGVGIDKLALSVDGVTSILSLDEGFGVGNKRYTFVNNGSAIDLKVEVREISENDPARLYSIDVTTAEKTLEDSGKRLGKVHVTGDGSKSYALYVGNKEVDGVTYSGEVGSAIIDNTGVAYVTDDGVINAANIFSGGLLNVGVADDGSIVGGGTVKSVTIGEGGVVSMFGTQTTSTVEIIDPETGEITTSTIIIPLKQAVASDVVLDGGKLIAGTRQTETEGDHPAYIYGLLVNNGTATFSSGYVYDTIINGGTVNIWNTDCSNFTINNGGTLIWKAGGNADLYDFTQNGGQVTISSGRTSDYNLFGGLLTIKAANKGTTITNLLVSGGVANFGASKEKGSGASVRLSAYNITIQEGTVNASGVIFKTTEEGENVITGGTLNLTSVTNADAGFATVESLEVSGGVVNASGAKLGKIHVFDGKISATDGSLADAEVSGGILSAKAVEIGDLEINDGGKTVVSAGSISGAVVINTNGVLSAAGDIALGEEATMTINYATELQVKDQLFIRNYNRVAFSNITLNIDAVLEDGDYKIFDGAADFVGTITVSVAEGEAFVLSGWEVPVVVGDYTYMLKNLNGTLALNVKNNYHDPVEIFNAAGEITYSGATAENIVLANGTDYVTMNVLSGATVIQTTVNGGEFNLVSGIANGVIVNSGAFNVTSGAISGGVITGGNMAAAEGTITGFEFNGGMAQISAMVLEGTDNKVGGGSVDFGYVQDGDNICANIGTLTVTAGNVTGYANIDTLNISGGNVNLTVGTVREANVSGGEYQCASSVATVTISGNGKFTLATNGNAGSVAVNAGTFETIGGVENITVNGGAVTLKGGEISSSMTISVLDSVTVSGIVDVSSASLTLNCADNSMLSGNAVYIDDYSKAAFTNITLNLTEGFEQGEYTLIGNGASFAGTLTVKINGDTAVTLSGWDTPVDFGNFSYSLKNLNGNLAIKVVNNYHDPVEVFNAAGEITFAGETDSNRTLARATDYVKMEVRKNAMVNNITVNAGGKLEVINGTAKATAISGGEAIVSSGAITGEMTAGSLKTYENAVIENFAITGGNAEINGGIVGDGVSVDGADTVVNFRNNVQVNSLNVTNGTVSGAANVDKLQGNGGNVVIDGAVTEFNVNNGTMVANGNVGAAEVKGGSFVFGAVAGTTIGNLTVSGGEVTLKGGAVTGNVVIKKLDAVTVVGEIEVDDSATLTVECNDITTLTGGVYIDNLENMAFDVINFTINTGMEKNNSYAFIGGASNFAGTVNLTVSDSGDTAVFNGIGSSAIIGTNEYFLRCVNDKLTFVIEDAEHKPVEIRDANGDKVYAGDTATDIVLKGNTDKTLMEVRDKGTVTNTTVKNGGSLTMYGGVAQDTTIREGGFLSAAEGAKFTGVTTFDNVDINFSNATKFGTVKIVDGTETFAATTIDELEVVGGTADLSLTGVAKKVKSIALNGGSINICSATDTISGTLNGGELLISRGSFKIDNFRQDAGLFKTYKGEFSDYVLAGGELLIGGGTVVSMDAIGGELNLLKSGSYNPSVDTLNVSGAQVAISGGEVTGALNIEAGTVSLEGDKTTVTGAINVSGKGVFNATVTTADISAAIVSITVDSDNGNALFSDYTLYNTAKSKSITVDATNGGKYYLFGNAGAVSELSMTINGTTRTLKVGTATTIDDFNYMLSLGADNTLSLSVYGADANSTYEYTTEDNLKGVGRTFAEYTDYTEAPNRGICLGTTDKSVGEVSLKLAGFGDEGSDEHADRTRIYGGVANADMDARVKVDFVKGKVGVIATGAYTVDNSVGGVDLTIGGTEKTAEVNYVYAGGYGSMTGSIVVQVLDGAHIAKEFVGGSYVDFVGAQKQSTTKNVYVNIDGGKFDCEIIGGNLVYARDGFVSTADSVVVKLEGATLSVNENSSVYAGGYVIGNGNNATFNDCDYSVAAVTMNIFDTAVAPSGDIIGGAVACDYAIAKVGSTNIIVDSSALSNVYGGGYAFNNGKSMVEGNVTITIGRDATVGTVYGGGLVADGGVATVGGTISITLQNNAIVGTIDGNAKKTDDSDSTATMTLDDFTGKITESITGVSAVNVSGNGNGTIIGTGADKVSSWTFDMSSKEDNDRAALTWENGTFAKDSFDLKLSTDNVDEWTLVDLAPEGNVHSGAFDGTTFKLFIDGNDKGSITLNTAIIGTGSDFDGMGLIYKEDGENGGKLMFGTITA